MVDSVLVVIVLLVIFSILQFFSGNHHHSSAVQSQLVKVEQVPFFTYKHGCRIPSWNNVYNDKIPNATQHEKWFKDKLSREDNLRANLSLLGAYVYPEYMAVTITSQNLFGRKVYCRYFDCKRREIQPAYESKIFPEATAYCGRRPGAEFVSLTHELVEKPQFPIPILDRTMDQPIHNFSVCMAPIYGDDPKWLQIVEFVEHYKLQGATMFYIYVVDVDPYSRILLDDYVRTGEIELIMIHDRYEKPDWLFHMLEILDCHQRAKYHSKWIAFVDIDERMHMTNWNKTIGDYLEKIKDEATAGIIWRTQWVQKTENCPAKFESREQLDKELMFLKYQNTSGVGDWGHSMKGIARPTSLATGFIHTPGPMYKGYKTITLPPSEGVVRHYRNTEVRRFGNGGWVENLGKKYHGYNLTRYGVEMEAKMIENVRERVEFVYDMVKLDCHWIAARVWQGHHLKNPCDVEKEKRLAAMNSTTAKP